MHNIIAQAVVSRSREWSKDDAALRLAYLTKNLKVGICPDTGEEVLMSTSNQKDIFCLHNLDANEIENDLHKDLSDVNEFRRAIVILRKRVLEID